MGANIFQESSDFHGLWSTLCGIAVPGDMKSERAASTARWYALPEEPSRLVVFRKRPLPNPADKIKDREPRSFLSLTSSASTSSSLSSSVVVVPAPAPAPFVCVVSSQVDPAGGRDACAFKICRSRGTELY